MVKFLTSVMEKAVAQRQTSLVTKEAGNERIRGPDRIDDPSDSDEEESVPFMITLEKFGLVMYNKRHFTLDNCYLNYWENYRRNGPPRDTMYIKGCEITIKEGKIEVKSANRKWELKPGCQFCAEVIIEKLSECGVVNYIDSSTGLKKKLLIGGVVAGGVVVGAMALPVGEWFQNN